MEGTSCPATSGVIRSASSFSTILDGGPDMKRILIALVAATSLSLAGTAFAAEEKAAAEKPDCTAQKTAHEEAVTASKAKPDLSSCDAMKGKEKAECLKPLKDKAKEDSVAAKAKVKEAKL